MPTSVELTAELDLGMEATNEVTSESYRKLIRDLLACGFRYALILAKDVTEPFAKEGVGRVTQNEGDNEGEDFLKQILKEAQRGFRLILVFDSPSDVLCMLESHGYAMCSESTAFSKTLIKNCKAVLAHHIPESSGALVFGHDYDPAFIFDISKER